MKENRFFIGKLANLKIMDLISVVFGGIDQRLSNNETKIGVKLPLGDTATHGILNSFTEYTHKNYLIEMAKPEWESLNI